MKVGRLDGIGYVLLAVPQLGNMQRWNKHILGEANSSNTWFFGKQKHTI